MFLDYGILKIDLSIASLKVALEDRDFKEAARKAYDHAIARVYTEAEKIAIRKEYLDVIRDFGSVGLPSNTNT